MIEFRVVAAKAEAKPPFACRVAVTGAHVAARFGQEWRDVVAVADRPALLGLRLDGPGIPPRKRRGEQADGHGYDQPGPEITGSSARQDAPEWSAERVRHVQSPPHRYGAAQFEGAAVAGGMPDV